MLSGQQNSHFCRWTTSWSSPPPPTRVYRSLSETYPWTGGPTIASRNVISRRLNGGWRFVWRRCPVEGAVPIHRGLPFNWLDLRPSSKARLWLPERGRACQSETEHCEANRETWKKPPTICSVLSRRGQHRPNTDWIMGRWFLLVGTRYFIRCSTGVVDDEGGGGGGAEFKISWSALGSWPQLDMKY